MLIITLEYISQIYNVFYTKRNFMNGHTLRIILRNRQHVICSVLLYLIRVYKIHTQYEYTNVQAVVT